jgi:hypothetical protein
MVTKKKLEVFLSSDIKEFKRERRKLAKMINRMPFLQSTPLEARGADTEDVTQASLNAVREADIYAGIFGKEYSATTIKEYHEAVKKRKISLNYVKRVKRTDPRLEEFIKNELSTRFKYHNYRTAKELETQLKKDLNSQLSKTLARGLQSIQGSKDQAQSVERKARRLKTPALQFPPYISFLNKASLDFKDGDYLQSIIMSGMAVEIALRDSLKNREVNEARKLPLGQLIVYSQKYGGVTSAEANQLREIAHIRNLAIHEGQIPSKQSAAWVLNVANSFVSKLSEGQTGSVPSSNSRQ